MTRAETFAWILLAIPPTGGELWEIIATADYFQKSIPSQWQLRTSLGWLQAKDLVSKKADRYMPTDKGTELSSNCRFDELNISELIDAVALELSKLDLHAAPHENITLEDTTRAYDRYKKEFAESLKKIENRTPGL